MPVPLRRAARAAALLGPALLVIATTAPASAAPPVSWPDDENPLSTLEQLLLLVGAPLALLIVITLLVMAPSIAKGSTYRSHVPWYAEPMQFGTLPGSEPHAGTSSRSTAGGGASVRW